MLYQVTNACTHALAWSKSSNLLRGYGGLNLNEGLHAKVPLVAFLAGVHFRVAGFVVVLGGAGSRYERGVHHGAGLEQQTELDQQVIDGGQDLFGQLVLFKPMTESQDGALVRHARELWELGKFQAG